MVYKKLSHRINMENFINQLAGDHDLIDELITNAVEGANEHVNIIHQGEKLLISNDGPSLNLEQLEKHLLTAFETGDTKSFESNRGLGFITIYRQSVRTIVKTGTLQLVIQDWDDITISNIPAVNGFHLEVDLDTDAQIRYSPEKVKKHLSQWIYWGQITIYFGKSQHKLVPIGQKYDNPLNYTKHAKYNYANLRYSLDLNFTQHLTFLYKLTSVSVYRILPLHLEIDSFINPHVIDHVTLVISHGAYLDATRRSLSNWGRKQVTTLLELINHDLQVDKLRRSTFTIQGQALYELEKRLTKISDYFDIETSWIDLTRSNFAKEMKNHKQILHELAFLDLFFVLLSHLDIVFGYQSMIDQFYHDYPSYINLHFIEPTPNNFHSWLEQRFQHTSDFFFRNIVIGFFLKKGDISGEVTVQSILKHEYRCIPFSSELFASSVVEYLDLAVILHEQADYLANLDMLKTTYDDLVGEYGIIQPESSNLTAFQISSDTISENNPAKSKIQTGVKDNIPYLLYPDGNKILEQMKTEIYLPIYNLWRAAVQLCIDVYNQDIKKEIIPVVVLNQSSTFACQVHQFIGLSAMLIEKLHNTGMYQLRSILLYTAIHEVAHIFCKPHSHQFYRITNKIYEKLLVDNRMELFLTVN